MTDAHRVLIGVLILFGLIGCVLAIAAATNQRANLEPKLAALEGEVCDIRAKLQMPLPDYCEKN